MARSNDVGLASVVELARRELTNGFEHPVTHRATWLVIDLDESSVHADPVAQNLSAAVNTRAAAVRAAGGVVAWVLSRMDAMPKHFSAILGEALAEKYFSDGHTGGGGTRLWAGLHMVPDDLRATKSGASAFFPGKCDLKAQLDAHGIDTVLIAGLVTNICCESSARDAAELEYKVILISDALSGQAHGLHEATLATFYRIFGDVPPSAEVIGLLQESPQGAACRPTSSRNRQ